MDEETLLHLPSFLRSKLLLLIVQTAQVSRYRKEKFFLHFPDFLINKN
jgi:hypothetical protein